MRPLVTTPIPNLPEERRSDTEKREIAQAVASRTGKIESVVDGQLAAMDANVPAERTSRPCAHCVRDKTWSFLRAAPKLPS